MIQHKLDTKCTEGRTSHWTLRKSLKDYPETSKGSEGQALYVYIYVLYIDIEFLWIRAVLTETGKQSKMHCTLYINHHCWLHHAMHDAKPSPYCKHWKQFSAYDKPFDWLEIVSRYNRPMVQTFACSSLSPSDNHLLWLGKDVFLKSM